MRAAKTVTLLEDIPQPPFMFLMKLHVTREEIDRAWIVLIVRGSGAGSHLDNLHDRVTRLICLGKISS